MRELCRDFTVEIRNPESIPAIYNSENGYYEERMGHFRFNYRPIEGLSTFLTTGDQSSIMLETLVIPTKRHGHDKFIPIPYNQIKGEFDDDRYEFDSLSEHQVSLCTSPDEMHEIFKVDHKNKSIGAFKITTHNDGCDGPESLEETLNTHSKLVETFVRSVFEDAGVKAPPIRYSIDLNARPSGSGGGYYEHETSENGEEAMSYSFQPPQPNVHSGGCSSGKDQSIQELLSLEAKIMVINPEVSFSEIGGAEQGKADMDRIYDTISNPEALRFSGIDPEKLQGYFISGPSGVGKSLLVRALATKLLNKFPDKLKFYSFKYSQITSTYRGGEAMATAKLFDLARMNESMGIKTLMFFDEIHAVAQKKKEHNEALDELLVNLDGMERFQGLTFIGATYADLDTLDEAIFRRLNNRIGLKLPDEIGRREIFDIHLNSRNEVAAEVGVDNLFGDLDFDLIVQKSSGFTGDTISKSIDKALQIRNEELKALLGDKFSLETLRDMNVDPISNAQILFAMEKVRKEEQRKNKSNPIGFGAEARED